MYCPSCSPVSPGADDANSSCSRSPIVVFEEAEAPIQLGGGGVGFSSRINEPGFVGYRGHSSRWPAAFSLVLAAAATVGFALAGSLPGSRLQNPQALYLGLFVAGMLVIVGLAQIRSGNRRQTWDGTIVDKRVEFRRQVDHQTQRETSLCIYTVGVISDSGQLHTMRFKNDAARYGYFALGDRVRYHGGLGSYERYDKSQDRIIFCNVCGARELISQDFCSRCRYPLLK